MSRICIIGNSHVGAFKEALTDPASSEIAGGSTVKLFGSHRDTLANAEVTEDGVLRSRNRRVKEMFAWTSGGQTEVALRDYDAIYIALGRSFFDMRPFWVQSQMGGPAVVPPMSDTLVESMIAAVLERWDLALARMIAEVEGVKKVVFLGAPFVSAAQPDAKALLARLEEAPSGMEAAQLRRIGEALERAAQNLSPSKLEVCRPPEAALEATGLFTQASFAVGSKKLSDLAPGEHPKSDYGHMNADYGRLVLRESVGLSLGPSAEAADAEWQFERHSG